MVNLAIIPDGWEQRHAAALTGTHTATVKISAPPAGGELWTWDTTQGKSVPASGSVLHPSLTARVQRLREEAHTEAGGQGATTQRYLIALGRDVANVGVGCIVDVTASSDPDLTGQRLHVVDELRGSLRFERHLLAVDHLTP